MKAKFEPASKEEWKNLLLSAQAFNKLKPWEWTNEDDVYAIKNPEDGEVVYCVIMGSMQTLFGLTAYIGDEGFASIERMIEEFDEHSENLDPLFYQKCLYLSFEDKKESEQDIIDIAKQTGVKFKTKKDWPMFRTFEPNYFPWFLNKKEVLFFTHILEQSCILLKEAKLNPKKLIAKKKDHYVLKYFEKGEWKTGEIKPNEYIKPEIKPIVDLNLLDKVKKISIKKGLVWEIQSLRMPDPIMDEGDEKPYYPYVVYIIDKKLKEPLENDTFKYNKLARKLPELVLKTITDLKIAPEKIHTSNQEIVNLVKDICKDLNIKLEVKKMSSTAKTFSDMMLMSSMLAQMGIDPDAFEDFDDE